ncbi:MAG: FAD-binding oxidoreductase [Chlamydiia bacterium]|nr:FAD-binding oxidoreductase [Chlamydiia bacterium]
MTLPRTTRQISGWGHYPVSECLLLRPERYRQLKDLSGNVIARGLGRSYGDAALNGGHEVMLMERIDRFLDFDAKSGLLRAEGGVSLEEIVNLFVPRGWFLPVTPGTKYVTLGGAFAADVHGKNHHGAGSFSDHVKEIEVITPGSAKRCSPNDPLFQATAGGMGLTGIISEMTLQMQPIETAYIIAQHYAAENFDAAIRLLDHQSLDAPYSVAWIDCLSTGKDFGRSILMCGRHAKKNELEMTKGDPLVLKPKRRHSVPFYCPGWVLNNWSIKAFNAMYYAAQSKKKDSFVIDYDSYFYPLDCIDNWNRMYGKRGFLQYQFVVPEAGGYEALRGILTELTQSGRRTFLAVLKRFGDGNTAPLSFPMRGYTLALDMPITDEGLFPFLDTLDHRVHQAGGRVYLAKDARLSPEMFRAMYPRYGEWLQTKEAADPRGIFQSDLSRRLRIGGSS